MLVNLSLLFLVHSRKKENLLGMERSLGFVYFIPLGSIEVISDLLPPQMTSLEEQASRLEKVGGLEGLKIQQKLNAIRERKQQIKDLCQSRREKLQTTLLLALFYQNLEEVRGF